MTLQRIKYQLQRWRWYRPIHLAYTAWRARFGGLPDWSSLRGEGSWGSERYAAAPGSGKVLIATGAGGHLPSMTIESLLGVALGARGATADFLLCDAALPACMMCEINWYPDVAAFAADGPSDRCGACYAPAARMLDNAGLSRVKLSNQLGEVQRLKARSLAIETPLKDIAKFEVDGVAVGEHAMAGTLRFFARGDIEGEAHAEQVLRRYFEAALLTYEGCHRLFETSRYTAVVLNHGIYVPQGVIAETARRRGIRVVTWHPAYRRGCFIFNHDETYHHGLMNEPVSAWEGMAWGPAHREQIEQYLHSRWTGRNDWVKFQRQPEFDVEAICSEIGIDFSRPTVGLLTNVVWDAQLHYKANAFGGMLEWLRKTIAYFAGRSDLQLLIRVHPAELTGTLPSRQPVMAEIAREFPSLPSNVFIIPPSSRLSTYVAMAQCNCVLIYGTKTGVELAASGIPVIVAGEAWIRGKGLTLDAETEGDYLQLLSRLPLEGGLDEQTRERALKYAYHFFFRRMIPVECVREKAGWPPFQVDVRSLDDLMPGRSRGLDVICDGIMTGTPFIYPFENEFEAPAGGSAATCVSA